MGCQHRSAGRQDAASKPLGAGSGRGCAGQHVPGEIGPFIKDQRPPLLGTSGVKERGQEKGLLLPQPFPGDGEEAEAEMAWMRDHFLEPLCAERRGRRPGQAARLTRRQRAPRPPARPPGHPAGWGLLWGWPLLALS